MASTRTAPIKILPYPLPVGAGQLPDFKDTSRIEKLRKYIANTSDKCMYHYLVSMGETALITQLRQVSRQTGASTTSSNPSWKTICNTLLSEEQLFILSEHFCLREHLLPENRHRKRYMSTTAYTSKLFLAYVAGYLQSIDPGTPMTWLRDVVVFLINGMIDECLNKMVQTGIPKLVQERPYKYAGCEPAKKQSNTNGEKLAAAAENLKEGEEFKFHVVEVSDHSTGCPSIDQLMKCGWKYSESKIEIGSQKYWLVVLFAEEMNPISIARGTLDYARAAANDAAAEHLKCSI